MNRAAYLSLVAGLVFASMVGCSRPAPEQPRLSPEDDAAWNRIVAALHQLSDEYSEALEIEDAETGRRRREQLARVLDEASASAAHIAGPTALEVRRRLDAIRGRVVSVDYEVGAELTALSRQIVQQTHLRRTPVRKPDLANGQRVFTRACAACHGPDGTGPTSAVATAMDPPPPDVLHARRNWTPYETFNRITYGGIETAMPSFEHGLTTAERWDVVFHLFAERWPPCPKPLPPIRADELALAGDFELGNRFGYGAAACLRRDFLPPAP